MNILCGFYDHLLYYFAELKLLTGYCIMQGVYTNTFCNTLGVPFLNMRVDNLKGVGITPEF